MKVYTFNADHNTPVELLYSLRSQGRDLFFSNLSIVPLGKKSRKSKTVMWQSFPTKPSIQKVSSVMTFVLPQYKQPKPMTSLSLLMGPLMLMPL